MGKIVVLPIYGDPLAHVSRMGLGVPMHETATPTTEGILFIPTIFEPIDVDPGVHIPLLVFFTLQAREWPVLSHIRHSVTPNGTLYAVR